MSINIVPFGPNEYTCRIDENEYTFLDPTSMEHRHCRSLLITKDSNLIVLLEKTLRSIVMKTSNVCVNNNLGKTKIDKPFTSKHTIYNIMKDSEKRHLNFSIAKLLDQSTVTEATTSESEPSKFSITNLLDVPSTSKPAQSSNESFSQSNIVSGSRKRGNSEVEENHKERNTTEESKFFDKEVELKAIVSGSKKSLLKSIIFAKLHYAHITAVLPSEIFEASRDWRTRLRKQKDPLDYAVNKYENAFGIAHAETHSLEDLKIISEKDNSWRFILWTREYDSTKYKIHMDLNTSSQKICSIGFHDGRFDCIKLSSKFIDTSFCGKCRSFHQNSNHNLKCSQRCRGCGRIRCTGVWDRRECGDCNKLFTKRECYAAHKQLQNRNKSAFCYKYRRCKECNVTYDFGKNGEHVCGILLCQKCKTFQPVEHICVVR